MNLKELQEQVQRVDSLINADERGLAVWNIMLDKELKKLAQTLARDGYCKIAMTDIDTTTP